MSSQTLEVPDLGDTEVSEELFRHTLKPEWGMALLAWEREGRRAYQFEDGNLRKIQEGYYGLFEPVDEHDGRTEAVRVNLRAAITARQGGSERPILDPVCTVDEQILLFTKLFPGGFSDPEWIAYHRGGEESSPLKRHRDSSRDAALAVFGAPGVADLISGGRHAEFAKSIVEVLSGTDLVPAAHVKGLKDLEGESVVEYATASLDLVMGDGPFDDRFKRYLTMQARVTGTRPSWSVATALAALAKPQKHVAVRRSVFLRQAGSIAPTGAYPQKPNAASYQSFRRVVLGLRTRLIAAGHEPRDLLDVHDFIWVTLRDSALEQMKRGH